MDPESSSARLRRRRVARSSLVPLSLRTREAKTFRGASHLRGADSECLL